MKKIILVVFLVVINLINYSSSVCMKWGIKYNNQKYCIKWSDWQESTDNINSRIDKNTGDNNKLEYISSKNRDEIINIKNEIDKIKKSNQNCIEKDKCIDNDNNGICERIEKYVECETLVDSYYGNISNNLAVANIPEVSSNRLFNIGIGLGYLEKTFGFAIGLNGQNKNKNFKYKMSGAISTDKKWNIGLGLSYSFYKIRNEGIGND